MLAQAHLEHALERMQQIITVASRSDAPITRAEAFEHIVEELELAGFGSPEPPAIMSETRTFAPDQASAARRMRPSPSRSSSTRSGA